VRQCPLEDVLHASSLLSAAAAAAGWAAGEVLSRIIPQAALFICVMRARQPNAEDCGIRTLPQWSFPPDNFPLDTTV